MSSRVDFIVHLMRWNRHTDSWEIAFQGITPDAYWKIIHFKEGGGVELLPGNYLEKEASEQAIDDLMWKERPE